MCDLNVAIVTNGSVFKIHLLRLPPYRHRHSPVPPLRSPFPSRPDPLSLRQPPPLPFPPRRTSARTPSLRTSDQTCGPSCPSPPRSPSCSRSSAPIAALWPSHRPVPQSAVGS